MDRPVKLPKKGEWKRIWTVGTQDGVDRERLTFVVPKPKPKKLKDRKSEAYGPFRLVDIWTEVDEPFKRQPKFLGWFVSLPDENGGDWWHIWRTLPAARAEAIAVAKAIGLSVETLTLALASASEEIAA